MSNRNLLIAGAIILALAGVGTVFALTRGTTEEIPAAVTSIPTEAPSVEILPSDALTVTLKPGSSPKYILTIDDMPKGVTSLSYEITYDTTNKGSQGILGSPVMLKEGQTKYVNDKLVFGSESRGKYDLDRGVSNIQINIRLTYSDGSEKGWKGTLEI